MKDTAAEKCKQIPKGYLVVGINPHKKKHAAVVMTQDFTTYSKFKFDNLAICAVVSSVVMMGPIALLA